MSVAAVVVAYRSEETIEDCLRSLLGDGCVDEVIVVDNASGDRSAEIASSIGARVIEATTNAGFGAGVNRGAASTSAEFLLVLNPDAEIRPGTAEGLATHLQRNPNVAVAASEVHGADGAEVGSRRRFPRWYTAAVEPGVARRIDEWHYRRRGGNDVDWVSGASFMVRHTAFDQVGGFDEGFFLYSEEVDLAYRLQKAGWRVHWLPGLPTVHREGHSTSVLPAAGKVEWVRGYLRFSALHGAHPRLERTMLTLGLTGRALAWTIRGKRQVASVWWQAARATRTAS